MTRMIHADVLLVLDACACVSVHCHLPLSCAMFSKLPTIKILMAKIINERLELQFSHSKHPNLPNSIRDRYLCESRGLVKIACVDGRRGRVQWFVALTRREHKYIQNKFCNQFDYYHLLSDLWHRMAMPRMMLYWQLYHTTGCQPDTHTATNSHAHMHRHRPNLISREISDINRIARAVTFNGNKWKKYV